MPYVTGIERRAEKRGEKRGEERGRELGVLLGKAQGRIRAALELRFEEVTVQDDALIEQITDVAELDRLFEIAKKAESLAQVREVLQESAGKR